MYIRRAYRLRNIESINWHIISIDGHRKLKIFLIMYLLKINIIFLFHIYF
jgi:hypothetical protein